jgi:prepilin-type N-terminal cleavage/methylation domain-containing protein
MRRRSGFTLVEVLVSMALILFIMSILAGAFGAASQAVSDLKAAGDLAEKLRGATNVIKRDMEADHFTDSATPSKKLSDTNFWDRLNAGNTPVGFFRILQQQVESNEGADLDNIPSFAQTTTSLHYTIALHGTRRSDFLSALVVPGSNLLMASPTGPYANADNFYQDTPSVFSSQFAEVELFLAPTGDFTDATTGPSPQPLFALYRRQQLAVPGPAGSPASWTQTTPIPPAEAASEIEMSQSQNALGQSFYNSMQDLSMPVKRFSAANLAAVPSPSPTNTPPYARITAPPQFVAADMLLTDVLSFDVRILAKTQSTVGAVTTVTIDNEFRDLSDLVIQNFNTGLNPAYPAPVNGTAQPPFVFDTWSNQPDPRNPANDYTNSTTTPGLTAVPLFKNPSNNNKLLIQAIQITLRVWDFKTKKTRQVTIVQQM